MRLISVNEAGARLGLSPLTIRRLIQRGDLPHVRPAGRIARIPEEAVTALAREGYNPGRSASVAPEAAAGAAQ
jgi:excisionase family DNA binding protein